MAWDSLDGGCVMPRVKLVGPDGEADGELLGILPPAYLDGSGGRLGRVHTGLFGAEFLVAWATGPVVPSEEVAGVCASLCELSPDRPPPLPAEVETEVIAGRVPEAVLRVTEVRVGVYLLRHIGAVPEFRYPGCKPLAPLAAAEAPECVWFEGQKRVVLQRDAATEARLMTVLANSGLAPAMDHFSFHDLNGAARAAWFQPDPRAPAVDWIQFLASPQADALAAAGWRIESDANLGLAIHDLRDFFPAIQSDPDHGIDWFRFDVTGEFEGKRVSLIPQIAKAIADDLLEKHKDPDTRPEFLLLPCDNPADGHIRFPAGRFLAIVEQVRHLFHGRPGGGPIRLDRLGAAGVDDSLAIESSETTRALAALGRSLRDIRGLPDDPVPVTLCGTLRPYQTDGYRWLRFLAAHGLHGILADDMGLGKTPQTIAHLAAEAAAHPGKPSLVIAPTSVVPNWKQEFGKFAPSLKVLVLHGNDRADMFQFIAEADVVLTSYPLLTRDFAALAACQWQVLVLDEAQYIKNPKSITARNACGLKAVHRLCLSGTPLENHLGELWSLMRFLMPGFLGDEKTFSGVFRKPIERDRSPGAQVALNRRVTPLILRRTKDQVASDLPEKTLIVHGIDLNPRQADLYESVRAAMDQRVRDALAAKGLAKSHIIVLDALLKLRQICCHPQLLNTPAARSVTESAKLDFLCDDLLPTLIEEGRRILLFSQFTSMLQIIEEYLVTAEVPYLKLTGQTRERAKLVSDF
ncbi:MAG: SNF2-related protein, partial [Akkermansiaceae bacterium]|nr:SNF2-related protein [Akkermansiaceae bacterium]